MRISGFSRYALCAITAASLLSACGGSQPPIGVPLSEALRGSMSNARGVARSYVTLFSFDNSDGASPFAGLLNVNGTLYGTTYYGGTQGDGTVFSIAPSGQETVLHSFAGGHDGANPGGSLINVNGMLYGTTSWGGVCTRNSRGCGTVFRVTTDGKEKVLYNFVGHDDGSNPTGRLVNVNGTLYSTTDAGGFRRSGGTVFSVTTAGKERVLHIFEPKNGIEPSPLTNVNGTLYGTMYDNGYGTVFSVTLTGKARVLYKFAGPPDGALPTGGLLNVNGTLYGTTSSGGQQGCNSSSSNCGTVYRITTAGKEQVLYRFRGGPTDGGDPNGRLLSVGGVFYGTTTAGGMHGTVFTVTTAGKERVLHNFGDHHPHDGRAPLAGLVDVDGTLYGTTSLGGTYGYGTAFALTP
jgi:uncharacterized repeat protein (TIGR03803 family)